MKQSGPSSLHSGPRSMYPDTKARSWSPDVNGNETTEKMAVTNADRMSVHRIETRCRTAQKLPDSSLPVDGFSFNYPDHLCMCITCTALVQLR
jgi:hypothetical protein